MQHANSSLARREIINTPPISPFQCSMLMPVHPSPSRTRPEVSRRESPHDTVGRGFPPETEHRRGRKRTDLRDQVENIWHRDLFSRGQLNVSSRESSGSLLRVSTWLPGISVKKGETGRLGGWETSYSV